MNIKKLIGILAVSVLVVALVVALCVSYTRKDDAPASTDSSVPTSELLQTEPAAGETEPAVEETLPQREPGVYFVNILPGVNGEVTADRTEAREGDQIILTLSPKEGFELVSLTANGKKCQQTFTMPAEDVYVLGRFSLPDVDDVPSDDVPSDDVSSDDVSSDDVVYPNGDFFGSAGSCHSSVALDMSTDTGDNPYLIMDAKKATPLYAYVKDFTGTQFQLDLTVKVTGIRSDERYPKFGLMTNDGSDMVKFYLDMTTERQVGNVGAVHQKSGKQDDWAGQSTWTLSKKLDLSSRTIKLTLLRDGATYYYYIDGRLVATGNDLSSGKAATGIFSFGTSMKVTEYSLVSNAQKLRTLIDKARSDAADFRSAALTENYFTQSGDGVYTLITDSDAQHKVDDVISAGKIMREKFYSLKGKLTLTNADTWGQSRILISADPQNEYFIALEKVGDDSYQIFTMSKANEEGWNDWRLIEHADLNGNRNSIDFEVISKGDQLYFLIDGEICYTTSRVSMTESTVKFTGYNVGTTTVESLSLQVFANSATTEAYLAGKQEKAYESRFQTRMDALYKEYITDNGCADKGGTLILGDSNMDFWGTWEEQTGLTKYVNGYNVGIGGSTVKDWLHAYDQLIIPFNADRFVILVGGSDVNVWGESGEDTVAQLETLLKKIRADHPQAEIYYIYTTPSPSAYADGKYTPDKLAALVSGAKELCDSLTYVQGIDVKSAMVTADGQNSNEELFADDKVHMNEAGYQAFSDILYEEIFRGETFGAVNGYKTTNGIDLSKDEGQDATIKVFGGAPQYAYLHDVFTDKFCFETEFNVTDVLGGDNWPKFGLQINGASEMVKFFVDMKPDKTADKVGVVYQPTGGGDDWGSVVSADVPGMSFTGSDTVKMKLVRDGKAYYLYVNDNLVLHNEDGFKAEQGAAGIFSFNATLTASDYSVVVGNDANTAIQQAKDDVLALAKIGLTTNYFAETAEGVYTLTTDSNAENKVDDVKRGNTSLSADNYSVKGKLSLTDAGDWGQARLMVSADAKNEYVFALERTNTGKFQLFTMSKANQDGWDKWELILHQDYNGTNNSIAFEVVVIGNKLHLLIGDSVIYVNDSVSMSESTVKFTGLNVGTTTVENLDAQVFASADEANAYLADKDTRIGENFGSSQGLYHTTPGISLKNDKGENATIKVQGGAPQYAYLKDKFTDKFSFEAEFNVSSVLNNDKYPKFGLQINGASEMVKFFVDMTPEKTATQVGVVCQPTGGNDDWAGSVAKTVSGMSFTGSDTVKLKLVRDGKAYYLYVNDTLVLYNKDGLKDEKSAVGIFSFNAELTASNYKLLEGDAASDAIKAAKKETHVGENFGSSQNTYFTTDGVVLDNDKGTNATIQVVGGAPQYAYLKDKFTDKFSFEAEFNVSSVLNNDKYPKFGLQINGASEMVKFFVDMTPEKTATQVGVVYQPTGGGDDWAGSVSKAVSGMSFTGSDTVKLKLVRDGKTYFFYVNDNLVLHDANGFKDEKGAVGIFSFNTELTASKYKLLDGDAANDQIAAAMASVNFFANGDVDLSKDFGANVGTVSANTGKTEFITVKDFNEKDFYFEAKVHVNEVYNNDGYPKFGIFAENENTRENFFVDMNPQKQASVVGRMTSTKNGDAWADNWGDLTTATVDGMKFAGDGEYVTLALKKEGGRFFLYVNGEFAFYHDSAITDKTTIGIFGFNTGMELKEYFVNKKEGIGSLLKLNTEGEIGTVALGGTIWNDKTYTFYEMPSEFIGESYIKNAMKSDITFEVKKDGYMYVLTPERTHENSVADDLAMDLYDRIETPAWYLASYTKKVNYWAYERTIKAGETVTVPGGGNWHMVVVSELPIDPNLHQLKNYVFSNAQMAVLEPTADSGGTVGTVKNGTYPFADRGAGASNPAKLQNLPEGILGQNLIVDNLDDPVQATVTKAGKVFLIASTSDTRKTYFTNSEQGYTFVCDLAEEYGNTLSASSYNKNGYGLYVKNVQIGEFERTRKNYWSIPIFGTDEKLPAEPPVSIAITQMPTKTTYKLGEDFDPTGLVVMGTDKYGNIRQLEASEYVTVPSKFVADAYAAAVIVDDLVAAIPVTVTDADGNDLPDNNVYTTARYTTQKAPLLNGSVKRATVDEVIAAIKKMEADGATAFNVHLTELNEEYRNYESFKLIADCTNYPVMAIAYGGEDTREYRIGLMKEAVRAGFDIVDIRLDTFDANSSTSLPGTVFESANPKEVSMNADVIAKQKALVQEFKAMGAEVLLSAHVGVSLTEAEGVALAKEMEARGADVAKIVLGSSANSNQQVVMQTNQTLKKELGIKFYYNASGTASKPYRTASALFGTHMVFCYAEYHASNLDTYDYIKDLKAFYGTVPGLEAPKQMLKTNNGQQIDIVQLGRKIWTTRDYVFTSMPEAFIGKPYVKTSYGLSGQTVDVTVQKSGYLYVLTNAYKTDNSQAETLDELNYTKLDMAGWKFCDFTGSSSYIWVYEKYVEPGETLKLGQWSVVIASATKLNLESDTCKTADADMAVLKPGEGASVGNMELDAKAFADKSYTFKDMPYWLAGKNYIVATYGKGSAVVTRGGVVYMLTNTGNSGSRVKYFEDAGYEKVNVPAFTAWTGGDFGSYQFVVYKKTVTENDTVEWPSWAVPIFSGDLVLSDTLAKITPDGTTVAAKYDQNVRLFNNRTYFASGDKLTALHGKSYLYASFEEGGTGTVTTAGTVYVQIPVKNSNSKYVQLEADLIAAGYTPAPYRLFRNNTGVPGKSLGYAQKLYQKEVAVGDTVHFGQYNIVYFDTLSDEEYYEMPSVTVAAKILNNPKATDTENLGVDAYDPADRNWQGCPVVTVTAGPNGTRMWAAWFTGGNNELAAHNCAVLMYSDDNGMTWDESAVAVVHPDATASVTKPQLWTLDDGRLWVSWTQHTVYNDEAKFDGRMGTWAAICENPDDPVNQLRWSEPVRLFEGRGNGKITVLNRGQANEEWLTTAFDWIDRNYSKVYSSTDKGATWTLKGKAEVTGSTYNNAILTERKENGNSVLWMLLRQLEGNMKESFSYDGGVTWTNAQTSHIQHPNSAIYMGWTNSGKLLMINHKDFTGRNNLTAFLSEDGGKTWPYTLLLDARSGVSYPDVIESNGVLYVVYDYDRFNTGQMYMAKITEADIMAGNLVTEGSYLKRRFSSMGINGPQVGADALALDLSDKDVSASTTGSPAIDAFDKNEETRWCATSADMPQWLQIDLKDVYNLESVYMFFEQKSDWNYKVETSLDGVEWTEYSNPSAQKIIDVTINKQAQARYIRLTVESTTGGAWASVWEMEVYVNKHVPIAVSTMSLERNSEGTEPTDSEDTESTDPEGTTPTDPEGTTPTDSVDAASVVSENASAATDPIE